MTNEVLWSTTTKRGLDFTYNPSRNIMVEVSHAGILYIWDMGTGQYECLECEYITCTSSNSRYYYYDVSNDRDRLLVFNATTVEMLDLIEFTSLFFISGFTVLTRVCFRGDCSHVICSETKLGVVECTVR
jgi:hypothetical protein